MGMLGPFAKRGAAQTEVIEEKSVDPPPASEVPCGSKDDHPNPTWTKSQKHWIADMKIRFVLNHNLGRHMTAANQHSVTQVQV